MIFSSLLNAQYTQYNVVWLTNIYSYKIKQITKVSCAWEWACVHVQSGRASQLSTAPIL